MIPNKNFIYKHFILSDIEKSIVEGFMPGSLTIVLKAKKTENEFSSLVSLNDEVALRIPDCEELRESLETIGPIAATSANPSGEKPFDTYNQIEEKLNGIDAVVSFEMCRISNVASTVVKIENDNIKILREGNIKEEELRSFIFNG